jgi:hypothetical protein
MRSFRRPSFALGAMLLLGAGCQSLIGLEDPQLVVAEDAGSAQDAGATDAGETHGDHLQDGSVSADGATDDASSAVVEACSTFCTDADNVCNGKIGPSAYYSPMACNAVCARYEKNADADAGGSFACRRARLDSVMSLAGVGAGEGKAIDAYCNMVAVGGEDRSKSVSEASCGTNCENYCTLRESVCGMDRPHERCLSQCALLVDTGQVNAAADFMTHPDSIQCRLAHLSAAAATKPEVHCEHARINPIRSVDAKTGKPTGLSCDLADDVSRGDLCENYCHMVTGVCSEDNERVWASKAECLRVCKNDRSLPLGQLSDHDEDSWSCRRTHAYIALEEARERGVPKSHCSHAGLGGAGHCGPNACAVYCGQAERACGVEFASAFPGGRANCVERCGDFVGIQQAGASAPYSHVLGSAAGNTYACRLRSLIEALGGDATRCSAAVGAAAPCVDM